MVWTSGAAKGEEGNQGCYFHFTERDSSSVVRGGWRAPDVSVGSLVFPWGDGGVFTEALCQHRCAAVSDLEPLREGWFQWMAGVSPGIGDPDCEWDSWPVDPPSLPMLTPGAGGPASGEGLPCLCPSCLVVFASLRLTSPGQYPWGIYRASVGFTALGWSALASLVVVVAGPAQPEGKGAQVTALCCL